MKLEELQALIFSTLETARTQEGHTIYDKFHPLEVADIMNHVISALPLYPDFIVDNIQARIFDALPKELQPDILDHQIKELHRLHLTGKYNKEQLILLIFLLMLKFNNTFEEGITDQLEDVRDYYYTYPILTANDLIVEVEENPEMATSMVIHDYFIRVTPTYEFVPTSTTKSNYSNYLYNLKP